MKANNVCENENEENSNNIIMKYVKCVKERNNEMKR